MAAAIATTTGNCPSERAPATAASAAFTPRTVLPGDDLTRVVVLPSVDDHSPKTKKKGGRGSDKQQQQQLSSGSCKLGKGLSYDPTARTVVATSPGMLIHRSSSGGRTNTYGVLSNTKRYIPAVNDRVVGVVEERFGPDYYRVNIFGPHPALLHSLSFEGATKRNKPQLLPGTLLYCRVVSAPPDMDPEVSCKVGGDGLADGGASRKDWMTDEGTYGELKGGTTIRTSLGLARELVHPSNVVLSALGGGSGGGDGGGGLAFEVAIGVNGMVWVHSPSPERTIVICNAIQNSEVLTEEQTRGMVKALVRTLQLSGGGGL